MEKLQNISNNYMNLFVKTGKVEFFILSKNCLKLKNDIEFVDNREQIEENELTL